MPLSSAEFFGVFAALIEKRSLRMVTPGGAGFCDTAGMARAGGFGLAAEMVRRFALWSCVAALAGGGGLWAQGDETPTLRVYPNLVQIPTLVVDRDLDPVTGIAESRFFVSLDGGPKFRVTHARPEGDDPISLAIVLDVTQPFPELVKRMNEAAGGLAPKWLRAADHVTVYAMDCNLVRSVSDAVATPATLKEGVDIALGPWRKNGRERWSTGCKTPVNLWDSLTLVIQALSTEPGRRVVLVVTDGVDRGSKTSWSDLRQDAVAHGVAIFALGQPGDPMFRPGAKREGLFSSLCGLSGGVVMMAEDKDVGERLQQFVEMVRGRYILEFPHPVDSKGGYHDMDITIEKSDAVVLPAGIGLPVDNPAVLKDPNTVPLDPSSAPQFGKRRVLPN